MPQHAERDYAENVVVGSGFGGSVAAYRLAAAGREVRVLERGKPYGPGDFAREPWEMAANFWDPSSGRLGLFDVWTFRGLDAVVSAGLGGGSLIYANVLLRKPEAWFVTHEDFGSGYESWPITRADLDPHYDVTLAMLGAQPFPMGQPGFTSVKKPAAMFTAGERLGLHTELPPLAVSFRPAPGAASGVGLALEAAPYGNLHGRRRTTCILCGQCDIGCNTGSKNTLDHTYLSAAAHHGARIDTLTEVRSVAAEDSGYRVEYVVHPAQHDDGRPHCTRQLDVKVVRCKRLILAAGSLGTTYLLLRSKQEKLLPALDSPALGSRFSGNGDFLAVMYGAHAANGAPLPLHASRGPVITTAIGVPDAVEGNGPVGRGHYVEDAGYPLIVDWLLELRPKGLPLRVAYFAAKRLWEYAIRSPKSQLGSDLARLLGTGVQPGTSMPLLGMGRDIPDGQMSLKNKRYLAVSWTTKTSQAYIDGVRETMGRIAAELHAEKLKDDVWSYLRRSITVHPVGGAPMGHSSETGVCDSFGEVFGHDNLFIADGAVLPGSVGSNPSLTIAAVSDRMATAILDGRTRQP